jgi:hypothetical protein
LVSQVVKYAFTPDTYSHANITLRPEDCAMHARIRTPKSRFLSWFASLWGGRAERPERLRRRTPLAVELLEQRLTPTSLTDHLGTLTIILDEPGDALAIAASGTNQITVSSSNASSGSDVFPAGLTGATFNAGQLTLTSDSSINIVDRATGGSVAFNTSGTKSYAVPVTVSLINPLSAGVTFNGVSKFTAGLTVTTVDGDIVASAGSSINVAGNLSLTSNTNITLNGSVAVSGNTTLAANGAISAANAANTFGGIVGIAGVGSQFQTTSAASASISGTGGLALDTDSVTGNLTASATGAVTLSNISVAGGMTVTAGTGITQSGPNLSVGGNASFQSTSGDVVVVTPQLSFGTNSFGGDISASVQGGGNIQIENANDTTTLGTIHLGTGDLTINDLDFSGSSTITEDPHLAGITTDSASFGTIALNFSDFNTNIDLSKAANNIGGNVSIDVNGNFGSGDFALEDTNAAASLGQVTFNSYTVNSLLIDFTQGGAFDLGSLPGFALQTFTNLTIITGGDITENNGPITVSGNASFTSLTGNVTVTDPGNSFNGDLSAAVSGSNDIQLENSTNTTTLGAITLGTGSFTLTDSANFGFSTVTEDPNAAGIHTGTPPANTAQITINIANDSFATVQLGLAPNSIASTYAVLINGQAGGTTGDLGYRSTSSGASVGQLTLNQFTINNLTLELDSPTANVDLGDLGALGIPGLSGDVTVQVGGSLTQNSGPLTFPGNLTATAGLGITISSPLTVNGSLSLTAGGGIGLSANINVTGTLTATAGGSISITGPLSVGNALTATAAGNITQDLFLGTITTGSNAAFSATGASSQITLTNIGNGVGGAVSFHTRPTDTGSVAFSNGGDIVLGASVLGNGTFTITAGGSGTITEEGGATITQGKTGGLVSFAASATATSIDLSGGNQNLFAGPVSFGGAFLTSVSLEDANPLASLASISLTGVPSLAHLNLTFDGPAASIQLPSATLPFSLHLIEENDIALAPNAGFGVTTGNDLMLQSLNGSINLFGTVTVPGIATLQDDGAGNNGIQSVNPASVFGTLAINNAGTGANTILVGGTLTLGNSTITGNAVAGSLSITSGGSITQANATSLNVAVPVSFTAASDIQLTSATNTFGGMISATVNGTHAITISNAASTTTIGQIMLATGTLTLNDTHTGGGSTITETAKSDLIAQGPVVINIAADAGANVDLSEGPNLFLTGLSINGIAAGTTGNLGFRNSAPNASMSQVVLSHFSVNSLTVDFDLSAINFDASFPAFSTSGNITLITGGGNITQARPIVTSGNAVFSIGGFIGNASIILTDIGNKIASGPGATISFSNPLADNKQSVQLVNTADINLGTSRIGLGTFSLNSSGNIISTASITQAAGGGAVNLSARGNTISLLAGQFGLGNTFYGPVTYTGAGPGGLTTIGFSNTNPLATLPTLGGTIAATQTVVDYELRSAPVLLGNVSTAALIVTAGGSISQRQGTTLTVTGEATFTTTTFGIQLPNANSIAEVSLNNLGQNPVNVTTSGPIVLDTSKLGSGALTINSGGAITETSGDGITQTFGGNDIVAGTATFNAGGSPVLLDNTANQILGPIAVTANVFTLANTTNVILGKDAVSGALTVQSLQGTITQAPGTTVNVSGSAYFFASPSSSPLDSISLTNPGNTINGPINLQSPSFGSNVEITLNGGAKLAASSVQGTLTVTAVGISAPANITQLLGTSGPNSGTITATGASFTTTNGSISLQNDANDFGDGEVSLSAAFGVSLTDNNAVGVLLGPVSFGTGTFAVKATAGISQASGAITGSGTVSITNASALPANAISVSLTQTGNDVSGAGSFNLTNVTAVTITNQGNIALTGSTIATSADVTLTAGGIITLPNGTAGTLTLGSLTATANEIDLGNSGVNLTTTDANGLHLTGNVVINGAITLDTSASSAFIVVGNVINTAPSQPLTLNLADGGFLNYSGGTWNQGTNNLTIHSADVTVSVATGATLAMNSGTLSLTGTPASGGAPSVGNALDIGGTFQAGGAVVVSDGASDSIIAVNFGFGSALSVALGNTDGSLTLAGINAADRINLGSHATLNGFGGSAAAGTILGIAGGGIITGSFANPQDANGANGSTGNFFMGTDIVNATYVPGAGGSLGVSIQPTAAASGTSVSGVEPDGDLYTISVSGGTGLVVLTIPNGRTQEVDVVVRNSSSATTLTIATTANGGDGFTTINSLAIDGTGTATIAAAKTNLTGNITVGGPLASLTVRDWTGGTLTGGPSNSVTTAITGRIFAGDNINLQTVLGTLTAAAVTGRFGNTQLGTITATSFGTITVGTPPKKGATGFTTPGNFFANLVNTNTAANVALQAATINGTLTGNWDLAGPVGTVTVTTATTNWNLGRPNGAGVVNSGLVGNVTSLALGTATGVGIDVDGSIGALTAVSLDDSQAGGTLEALAFGTIAITGAKGLDNGNFIANLTATGNIAKTGALGAMTVAGNLGSATAPITFLFANGNVGTISASATVNSVTIDAAVTPTSGAITGITAGEWLNSNVTAASVGTWKVTGNLTAHLLGNFATSVVTLTGTGGTTPTLGAVSIAGNLNDTTFDIVTGGATGITAGGTLDNVVLELQSANGTLGSIVAGNWQSDTVTAASIGTVKSTGRNAAAAATPALVGNIANSTITAFAGGIGTFLAAGNLTAAGDGYLLTNGTIGSFTVGRAVNTFEVATNLNGGNGGIVSLAAGQWLSTDLATFALGSVAIKGFTSPDLLPGFTAGDFSNSDVVVTGSATSKGATTGISSFAVGNNCNGNFFNVPFGIGSFTVAAAMGTNGGNTLALLNPLSPSSSTLGSLKAGVIVSLFAYANQAGSITTTGTTQVQGDLSFSTLAFGFSGTGSAPTGLASMSVAGRMNGDTVNVKESLTTAAVGLDFNNCTIAVGYDASNASAGIKTLTCGAFNSNMSVGNIGKFSAIGNATTGLSGDVASSSITILGSLKGVAIGSFTASGTVYRSGVQVTSGSVTSFQSAFFINSGLFVGYRLVDALGITDTTNNQAASNWEGNFTLGSFKTTAVPSSAGVASDSFQSSEVVASTLGKLSLSAVNPTPTVPSSIPFNGNQISIPPALLAFANFGVGFRRTGGAAGSLAVGTTVEAPAVGQTPTLPPAFFYLGLGG